MIRSRVTFASTDAAAIEALTRSPFQTASPGEGRPCTGKPSVSTYAGATDGDVWFEVTMADAWVWDMYRPARFVKNVRVLTFKDVNVEELARQELSVELPPH